MELTLLLNISTLLTLTIILTPILLPLTSKTSKPPQLLSRTPLKPHS